MSVRFTFTPNSKEPTELFEEETKPEDRAQVFCTSMVGEKDGAAFIPGILRPCSAPCWNHCHPKKTDCGGGRPHRHRFNVASMTAFVADLDDVTEASAQAIVVHVQSLGVEAYVFETFNHDPEAVSHGEAKGRYRLVVPFAQPLELANPQQWSEYAWPALVRHFRVEQERDSSCRDPSRLYFLPRKPTAEAVRESLVVSGPLFDVHALLGDLDKVVPPTPVASPRLSGEQEDPTRPVDLGELKRKLVATGNAQVRELGERCARGERLTSTPGRDRHEGDLPRHEAWWLLLGRLSIVAEDWMATEALLEVVRASHTAERADSPDDYTPWDEGRDSVVEMLAMQRATAPTARSQYLAEREARQQGARHAIDEALRERREGQPTGQVPAAPDTAAGEPLPLKPRTIRIDTDESRVNGEALVALGTHPELFQQSGRLVRVVRDQGKLAGVTRPTGAPSIASVPPGLLRDYLTRVAAAEKFHKTSGTWMPAHFSEWTISALQNRGEYPGVRPLEALVEAPVLLPNGAVLTRPGYDAGTGILLCPPPALIVKVPEFPTRENVLEAVADLLEIVCDFNFMDDAHRAAFLSGILTPLGRYAFSGPVPLHGVDANMRGSGKTLVVDAISTLVSGRPMAKMPPTNEDEEMRKRITALAAAGDQMVSIDNVTVALGTPALDAALTSTLWRDRILGLSETRTFPLAATWFATGNNLTFAGDTGRRALHIRIESQEERPEERCGFRHPSLLSWVARERSRLLSAALTILRAYCVAGRPDQNLTPWGSYEGWSALIRNAIVWAGQPDPGLTRGGIATLDVEGNSLKALVTGLTGIGAEREPMSAKDILLKADSNLKAVLQDICPTRSGETITPVRLGKALTKFRRRPCSGRMLDFIAPHGTALWRVRRIGEAS
jgi:hypothetical protein